MTDDEHHTELPELQLAPWYSIDLERLRPILAEVVEQARAEVRTVIERNRA